jgi:predicted phage terminase large subunit-like protein
VAIGGNIIHGSWFRYYTVLPKIKYRKIFADTAQKTKERNDYSVFELWGLGEDNNMYLLDMIRGKWEAPELESRAIAFWAKHANKDVYPLDKFGQLRELVVEDKSSGTGLIQKIRMLNQIPIKPVERKSGGMQDKLSRVMDVVAYIDGRVHLPENAPFTSGFVSECEAFTADDSHDFDDQIDPLCDAINDMLSSGNKLKTWEKLI